MKKLPAERPGWHGSEKPNGRLWAVARRAALVRDKYRCTECRGGGRLEVHHRVPLFKGGDLYALAGLITLCRDCHISRHHRPVDPRWNELIRDLLRR